MTKSYLYTKESSGGVVVKHISKNEHFLNLEKHKEQILEAATNCFRQSKIQKDVSSFEHFRGQGIGMIVAYNLLVKKLNADSDLYLYANKVEEEARN